MKKIRYKKLQLIDKECMVNHIYSMKVHITYINFDYLSIFHIINIFITKLKNYLLNASTTAIMINQTLLKKAQSTKTQNSNDKTQQFLFLSGGAKIHRANILARIINSISLYKMQWAISKIKILANIKKKRHRKMGLAINRVFRRNIHQAKFISFQKIKKQLVLSQQHAITYHQKVLQSMAKASRNIILFVLKTKRRQIISQSFQKIKSYSISTNHERRTNLRKSIRKILQILYKNKKYAFQRIYNTRSTQQSRQKLKTLLYILSSHRKSVYTWAFWKLKKNHLTKKCQQVTNDIKIFETKINNNNDPQLQAIKQKKDKLQEHLNKVQQQKNAMQQQFMNQYKQMQNRRLQIQNHVKSLEEKKQELKNQISRVQEQINSPYSIDQIYQCVYNNFLLYLSQNKQKIYNKQQLLKQLTYPLIPIDVPIDTIKQQNSVMQQLINEYIVMFGPKKAISLTSPNQNTSTTNNINLQHNQNITKVQLPYQYLVRENHVMYKMLLTLLPKVQADRDDLRVIKDSLYKLSKKVQEFWGR